MSPTAVLGLYLILLQSHAWATDYGCPSNPYIDDFMRDVFVGYHLTMRKRIAQGGQLPNTEGYLGPAKNMYELKWDCGLEKKAQEAISHCETTPLADVSQNIASFPARTGPYSNWTNAVWGMIGWLRPSSKYGINNQNKILNLAQGNFGNMVYSKSTKFGCAYKTCGDQFIVTCLYNHIGNVPNIVLWEDGKPCRRNEDCTTYEGSTCSNSLCIDSGNKDGVTGKGEKPTKKGEENSTEEKGNGKKEEERKMDKTKENEKKKYEEKEGKKKPNKEGADEKPRKEKPEPSEEKPKKNGGGNKPSPKLKMCPGSKITAEARQLFLDLHNNLRRKIAFGTAPNNVGFIGPAKNMYKMEWKCQYEKWAQETANACSSNSDLGPASNGASIAGQGNQYIAQIGEYINETFAIWANTPQQVGTTNIYENWYNYYFGNIAMAKATKLGCAYNVCGDTLYVNCIYSLAGNFQGTVMWEKGPACKKNADCTTYPGSTCDNGLCVAGGGNGMAIGGTNKMCPKNKYMNDEAREKFLERHNSLRSSLAKGEQKDPLGVNGFAPKAARMRKMVWDCEIEYNSQKHASSCVYDHSPPSARPGLGQNLFFSEQITLGVTLAAAEASNSWWSELSQNGVPPENRITPKVYYRKGVQIGHYTQMAWQNSYKLGCGISWCEQFTYVVCEYGPGGNTMYQLIYDVGNPCSNDADCQCDGCKCSREEALCIMP